MSGKDILLLSGIPASHWGTGRLVAHLEKEVRGRRLACRILARPERTSFGALPLAALISRTHYELRRLHFERQVNAALRDLSRPLLILHPQNLGFRLTLEAASQRRMPTALFLLDSSFFCISSYNHVQEETAPCTRCAGGHFDQAQRHGCLPFPKPDDAAREYVLALRQLVREGRVVLIAQTCRQADLAQRHFELPQRPDVVGLWTDDLDSVIEQAATSAPAKASSFDVVYHGFDLEPKGARWLEKVARHMPARQFFFPFAQPPRNTPPNCRYEACTWESGLEPIVRAASIVAVPSLWSAPIEGALVKSIALSAATAVVANPSAYADELPENLVLVLPEAPALAAQRLEEALREGWRAARCVKQRWLAGLREQRHQFVDRLLGSVPGFTHRPSRSGTAA